MNIDTNFRIREARFKEAFEPSVNENEKQSSFQDVLKTCIDEVNEKNVESNSATDAFVKGDDISIDEVMIKATEASLSLQFLTTTRDKLVEGYNQLIKMPM